MIGAYFLLQRTPCFSFPSGSPSQDASLSLDNKLDIEYLKTKKLIFYCKNPRHKYKYSAETI